MNNFDTRSTGVNLELNVFWDTDLSQNYFNESFHVLQYSGVRQHSILIYNWCGELDQSDFDFENLDNYNLKSITNKNLLANIRCTFYGDSKDLKSDCLAYFDKYPNQLNKSELLELIENAFPYDYQEFLQENLTPTYQTLVSRGYSQGDYSEIIFTAELLDMMRQELTACKEMTDQEIAEYFQDDIDHLLWDAPLYARLDIDDDEYYLDDIQKDRYSYDKDEIINHVKNNLKHEKLDIIVEFLSDNLPDQPDYK